MQSDVTAAAVHPRACGERRRNISAPACVSGSSPRLRGTHASAVPAGMYRRFIPAPAGNAFFFCRSLRGISVHPRACGERRGGIGDGAIAGGSSPRLRGTQLIAEALAEEARFIPAPAGNAGIVGLINGALCGSSPRLRGTHSRRFAGKSSTRFIPAPAGNAKRSWPRGGLLPVHPRACGERETVPRVMMRVHGSSPRLRGTRRASCRMDRSWRFIPAPAGNASTPGDRRQ